MESALQKVASRNQGTDVPDFDIRGELYQLALALAPDARRQDVDLMLQWLLPHEGERGVDIAAGTGFLTEPIVKTTKAPVIAIDPSEQQLAHARLSDPLVVAVCGSPDDPSILTSVKPGTIDFVTSFGGIHHVPDQQKLFGNVSAMLQPGGRFVAADVCADTALAAHFDDVVAAKCITGHSAIWLDENRIHELTAGTSLQVLRMERVNLRWYFETAGQMALFFKGLHAYNVPLDEILNDLKAALGTESSDGGTWINWPMLVFELRKASEAAVNH
jgi:SAM-dependent methyltransferase